MYQLERGPLEIVSLTSRTNDRAYWMSKTPEERFEALEYLRQLAYGYDPATERLQRVIEVVPFKPR